jgi:hypothetical protein
MVRRGPAAVIDLEGRVLDAEAVIEHTFKVAADRMTVIPRMDKHMRGERWEVGADRPDMKVVNTLHVRVRGERLPDLFDVHALGSRFEQDTTGVP